MRHTLDGSLFFACVLPIVASACGGNPSGENPTGPTDERGAGLPISRSLPVDTNFKRLKDGAGQEGPISFKWQGLWRINAQYVSFIVDVCMDPVPNPTGGSFLSKVKVSLFGSLDGINPYGRNSAFSEGGVRYEAVNGECVTFKRLPISHGGTAGTQYLILEPEAKYVVIAATYGPDPPATFPSGPTVAPAEQKWSVAPCEPPEVIAKMEADGRTPQCVLRAPTSLE